jgi:hypothetical protein
MVQSKTITNPSIIVVQLKCFGSTIGSQNHIQADINIKLNFENSCNYSVQKLSLFYLPLCYLETQVLRCMELKFCTLFHVDVEIWFLAQRKWHTCKEYG